MVFPVVGGNESKGYDIENSLRFDRASSPYLNRTPSSTQTSNQIGTISYWVKRSTLSAAQFPFHFYPNRSGHSNDRTFQAFDTNDRLTHERIFNGSTTIRLRTNRKFRDVSAWYHIVIAIDTTQSTASNRMKLYVNGVQETDFETATYPSQNDDIDIFEAILTSIGVGYSEGSYTGHCGGYFAEFHAIDGQQLAQTSFGEFDDNGVWIPIKYTGTYGNNGFYLEFKQTGTSQNSSGIGADTSGNDNHFAVTNLAALDVTEDTCTNNFATLNAVDTSSNITLTEGNTIGTANSNHSASRATIGLNSGKWYWENKIISDSGGPAVGVMAANAPLSDQLNSTPSRFYRDSGQKISDGTGSSYGNTYTTNDIIGVALDLDNGAIYFYKNGTAENSGTAAFTDLLSATTESWLPAIKLYNEAISINFGNPSFSISSGNTDGKYGNFEYAPPSGYYALCTKRLAEFG